MSTENKQFTEKTAPEGYWIDAKGVLTPVGLIKDTDQMRDDLVRSIVEKATALNAALAEFKLSGFSDIGAFVDISASQYGVSLGGKKGNVTLYSYDGRYKVQRAMHYLQMQNVRGIMQRKCAIICSTSNTSSG